VLLKLFIGCCSPHDHLEVYAILFYMQLVVPCSKIPNPDNGRSSCASLTQNYGSNCTFTCNSGYELTSTRTCLHNETWSSANPVCIEGELCIIVSIIVLVVATVYVTGFVKTRFPHTSNISQV